MRRTYLDSGVLIAAFQAKQHGWERAVTILEETDRIFLASPFLEFELLPQAIRNHRHRECDFYERYLARADWIDDLGGIFRLAFQQASRSPVSGIDALHVVAASLLRADELITTERPGKTIYRNSLVRVLYLL